MQWPAAPLPKPTEKRFWPKLTANKLALALRYGGLINMPSPLSDGELLQKCFVKWAVHTYQHLHYGIVASAVMVVNMPPPPPNPHAEPEPDPVITPPRDWPDSDESLIYDCIGDLWDPFTDHRAPDCS